jgi:hypothetical protein
MDLNDPDSGRESPLSPAWSLRRRQGHPKNFPVPAPSRPKLLSVTLCPIRRRRMTCCGNDMECVNITPAIMFINNIADHGKNAERPDFGVYCLYIIWATNTDEIFVSI